MSALPQLGGAGSGRRHRPTAGMLAPTPQHADRCFVRRHLRCGRVARFGATSREGRFLTWRSRRTGRTCGDLHGTPVIGQAWAGPVCGVLGVAHEWSPFSVLVVALTDAVGEASQRPTEVACTTPDTQAMALMDNLSPCSNTACFCCNGARTPARPFPARWQLWTTLLPHRHWGRSCRTRGGRALSLRTSGSGSSFGI